MKPNGGSRPPRLPQQVGSNDDTQERRLIREKDATTISLHSSLLSHHVVTLATCTFLQFGGTTTTGLFLGQNPSWAAGARCDAAVTLPSPTAALTFRAGGRPRRAAAAAAALAGPGRHPSHQP